MASAPTPGVARRAQATEAAATTLKITLKGETRILVAGNITFADRLKLRQATGGMSFESFWSGEQAIGLDSVMVIWWLAALQAGQDITLEASNATFPTDLGVDEMELVETTPDGDDPQA